MPETSPHLLTPRNVQAYLKEAFLRFYETAYEVRDAGVRAERRRLLEAPGAAFSEPLLELLPRYQSAPDSLADVMAELGVPEATELVQAGLLPHEHPYAHQAAALRASDGGKDVVVGTGTGSGKTEAFLLPVILDLVRESRGWGSAGSSATDVPWWKGNGAYTPQRHGETGRDAGIRALLLYPMNALVEDQLVRLRAALDSPAAREWLATHRPGHRFYFGRYTGRTPVPGSRETARVERVKRLRSLMKDADRRHAQLLQRIADGAITDADARYFLPAVDGAEMRSRWDMQHRAPDVLITNYSMLSIALSRSDEQGMINQTRRWLDGGDGRRFTLVVDELHMYRGTAGTEVAYLLRRLFHALGLDEHPERLRIIGTSASILDDEEGRQFLREMFGRPASRAFEFVRSSTEVPAGADDLQPWATELAGDAAPGPGAVPTDDDAVRALTKALTTDGQVRPARLSAVAERLFPQSSADVQERALERLVEHVATQDQPAVRLRAHYFARTLQGLWACARPDCPEVEPGDRTADRRIGKIYASARLTCECGSRVLELLYCQSCGESMLGGYVALAGTRQFLIPTTANLDELPDYAPGPRDASTYRVYWPTDRAPVVTKWERKGTALPDDPRAPTYRMSFARAVMKPGTGQLSVGTPGSTGVVFRVQADGAESRMPAFPTRCPSCGDDWEYTSKGAVEDRRRSGSPIRTQGVGFDRANQVLTGALKRRLQSSLVVFSDSRQGAARVAANLELAHYLDLVRALVLEALSRSNGVFALAEAYLSGTDTSDEAQAAYTALEAESQPTAFALMKRAKGMPLTKLDEEAVEALARQDSGNLNLVEVVSKIGPRLLDVGVNPAGPAPSLQETKSGRPWSVLYDWDAHPTRVRPHLDHEGRELLGNIEAALGTQVIRTVFAGGDRDVEALGIARAVPAAPFRPSGVPADVADEAASSLIRIVGRRRRTIWTSDGRDAWPRQAREYAQAVVGAAKLTITGEDLLDAFTTHMKAGAAAGFRLVPESVTLELAVDGDIWRCSTCQTRHLHRSAGVCVACLRPVTESQPRSEADEAYYTWLATQDGGIYRLHCEELSGQTDVRDAQARQARFQGVLVQDQDERPEVEVVDTVDILSVTTTMEAGVDIGALKAVVMANMPPQRFNYQQRVGRAGRRSSHFSAALTVCRGARSHDEHYFANPESITGDDPPQPFLDTSSVAIVQRAFAAEVLTRVFRGCESEVPGFDPGRSVHGQFGPVDDWRASGEVRAFVAKELVDGEEEWTRLAGNLLQETRAEVSATDLARWAAEDVVGLIDQAAASARVPDLSEALAQGGVLPMFGFPTTTRVLYTAWPKRDQEGTLDRDAPVALSEFAPGAELVKDKRIHTAVGVVDMRQRTNGTWYEGDEPLSPRRAAGVCRSCLALSDAPGASCSVCGATAPEYEVVDTAEPAGYRTSFKARDYEQLGDPTARASQPRMTIGEAEYVERDQNALVRWANTEIVSLNDNRGRLFTFVKASRPYEGKQNEQAGLLAVDLLERARGQQVGLSYVEASGEPLEPVALAARRRTDVLSLGAASLPPGLVIDPRVPAGRGAWGSLGFLVRDAAAKWLDIGPDEMEVGVYPVAHQSAVRGEVFIADSLENGAGYAARMFERLEDLLDVADEHAVRLGKHGPPACDSSCYQCLCDYSNRSWHPLLDWRLGVDLLDLIRGRSINLERHAERDLRAARAVAGDFGFDVEENELPTIMGRGNAVLAITHPFESTSAADSAVRVRSVRDRYSDARFSSSFELLRRPGVLLASLMG
ncbi:DEAD/DEAH box helicase [Cellulomonas iranensis]|nr:DEAD/DEAH box helicase [Cellulomonas iranensis]